MATVIIGSMNSRDILYSKGRNDECYTPRYVVEAILPYIPTDKVIWCPFDTADSEFVKVLQENGCKVTYSHIANGQDYYQYEPEHWDMMLSNPPFTNKRLIFERALSFNKPFALLMSNTWLNDAAPNKLFEKKDLQLLMFRKRINFNCATGTIGRPTFSSSFYCWNLLPKQIIMIDK